MKILNDITWEKPNPPPNLSCRYFTHSAETILWAAKNEKSKNTFHYQDMRQANGGKQMKSLLASTNENDLVFTPFAGSFTTGVAAIKHKRKFVGTELESEFIHLSINRLEHSINTRQSSLESYGEELL